MHPVSKDIPRVQHGESMISGKQQYHMSQRKAASVCSALIGLHLMYVAVHSGGYWHTRILRSIRAVSSACSGIGIAL
jgi:hypothetical protein